MESDGTGEDIPALVGAGGTDMVATVLGPWTSHLIQAEGRLISSAVREVAKDTVQGGSWLRNSLRKGWFPSCSKSKDILASCCVSLHFCLLHFYPRCSSHQEISIPLGHRFLALSILTSGGRQWKHSCGVLLTQKESKLTSPG